MIWNNLGLNVANDINFNGAAYTQSQIVADAIYHVRTLGIKKIRVGIATHTDAVGVAQTFFAAQVYKALGAYVQWGINIPANFGAANEAAYNSAISTYAAQAMNLNTTLAASFGIPNQSQPIDEFCCGNEIEIQSGITLSAAQIYTYMQTLPALVKAAGFTGKISVTVSQDNYAQYKSNGAGTYDFISLDVYGNNNGSFGNFIFQINDLSGAIASGKFQITEWGVNGTWQAPQSLDEYLQTYEFMLRLNWLKENANYTCYVFCWRFDGTNVTDNFASKLKAGGLRDWWFAVTEQKKPL